MWKPLDFPVVPAWPDPPNGVLKEYDGGCHCKRFRYRFTHPVFEKGEFDVVSCNCSICSVKGMLSIYTTYGDRFRFTSGTLEEATTYSFNTGFAEHKFCPTCGVAMLIKMKGGDGLVVNARTVDGIDPEALKLKYNDGKKQ